MAALPACTLSTTSHKQLISSFGKQMVSESKARRKDRTGGGEKVKIAFDKQRDSEEVKEGPSVVCKKGDRR